MNKVMVTTHVNAPPERVFAVIAHPRKPFLTSNKVTQMEIVGAQTSGIGTTYRWTFTLPLGLRFQFDEVVKQWVEPERFAYRATSGWKMEAVAALAPEGDGTRITFILHYRLPGRLGWLIPKWLVRLGCTRALANIRRLADRTHGDMVGKGDSPKSL